MEHPAIPQPPGFAKLSKAEKVRYLQALWDQISEDPDDVPVTESHLQLVEERIAEYRRAPERARPAQEVLDRLASKIR